MTSSSGSLESRTSELRRRNLGGWSSEQLLRLLLPNGLGLLMIAATTYETSRATVMREELVWLNAARIR